MAIVAATILGETLVETLVELHALRRLCDSGLPCAETEGLGERLAEQQGIIDYMHERFAELNRSYFSSPPQGQAAAPNASKFPIDVRRTRAELAIMDDGALFRYGAILKYICVVEARLLDLPLDATQALFHEVRAEWLHRFGDTAIAESF